MGASAKFCLASRSQLQLSSRTAISNLLAGTINELLVYLLNHCQTLLFRIESRFQHHARLYVWIVGYFLAESHKTALLDLEHPVRARESRFGVGINPPGVSFA